MEVIVFAEGQSDEQFIKRVVAPTLQSLQIYLKPQPLKTSKDAVGGAVSFDRLKFNARNALRQYPDAALTTFFDLYGLDTDFPEFLSAKKAGDVYGRVKIMENALHRAIVDHVGCRPERFIAYLQPYEFEGLFFSDVSALIRTEPEWNKHQATLQKIRDAFTTPEHINDSPETSPSKRLEKTLQPKYKKTRHGPLIAEQVTLGTMERECRHFKSWLDRLRCMSKSLSVPPVGT